MDKSLKIIIRSRKTVLLLLIMKIIINAKADPKLKEALRLVAQDESTVKTISSSALLVKILESDPRVAAKLKMLSSR